MSYHVRLCCWSFDSSVGFKCRPGIEIYELVGVNLPREKQPKVDVEVRTYAASL